MRFRFEHDLARAVDCTGRAGERRVRISGEEPDVVPVFGVGERGDGFERTDENRRPSSVRERSSLRAPQPSRGARCGEPARRERDRLRARRCSRAGHVAPTRRGGGGAGVCALHRWKLRDEADGPGRPRVPQGGERGCVGNREARLAVAGRFVPAPRERLEDRAGRQAARVHGELLRQTSRGADPRDEHGGRFGDARFLRLGGPAVMAVPFAGGGAEVTAPPQATNPRMRMAGGSGAWRRMVSPWPGRGVSVERGCDSNASCPRSPNATSRTSGDQHGVMSDWPGVENDRRAVRKRLDPRRERPTRPLEPFSRRPDRSTRRHSRSVSRADRSASRADRSRPRHEIWRQRVDRFSRGSLICRFSYRECGRTAESFGSERKSSMTRGQSFTSPR